VAAQVFTTHQRSLVGVEHRAAFPASHYEGDLSRGEPPLRIRRIDPGGDITSTELDAVR
jgi:hypothetical protein